MPNKTYDWGCAEQWMVLVGMQYLTGLVDLQRCDVRRNGRESREWGGGHSGVRTLLREQVQWAAQISTGGTISYNCVNLYRKIA